MRRSLFQPSFPNSKYQSRYSHGHALRVPSFASQDADHDTKNDDLLWQQKLRALLKTFKF